MPMYAASPDDVRCDSEILPPPTKADCRRLAESLLERLRQAGDDEAEALSEMTDELEELAEGLDANGLVQEDADQLQSLVHTLEGLGVGEIQAMGLCRQVIAVLERIIGALKPQRPAKRGRRFWK